MDVTVLLAIYAFLNAIAFAAFGWDKHKAKKGEWRTPEKTLLVLAFFGAFGALIGMYVFRHKTQKRKFMLVWVFAALHIAATAAFLLFYRL